MYTQTDVKIYTLGYIVDIAVYKYQNVIIEIMWARVSAFRIVRHL